MRKVRTDVLESIPFVKDYFRSAHEIPASVSRCSSNSRTTFHGLMNLGQPFLNSKKMHYSCISYIRMRMRCGIRAGDKLLDSHSSSLLRVSNVRLVTSPSLPLIESRRS